jgi:dUTP pyrophosphatase
MSILYIKPSSNAVRVLYSGHTTFHEGDSGLDLFFPEDVVIEAGKVVKIDLGISCEMIDKKNNSNVSYYLYARSSIADTPLMLANSVGIVDAAYRGVIKAAFRNMGTEPYTIKKGQRLVQICTGDLKPFNFELVESLSVSTRASGGFGSTGK